MQDDTELNELWERLKRCTHPEHTPVVLFLYIPPGQTYRHTCPGCGEVTLIHGGSEIRC